MREKYESLPLVELKALAKVRGLKGTSSMKKADLVELMVAEDEKGNTDAAGQADSAAQMSKPAAGRNAAGNDSSAGNESRDRSNAAGRSEGGSRSEMSGRGETVNRITSASRESVGRNEPASHTEQPGRAENMNRVEQQSRGDGPNRNEQQNRIDGINRNEQQSRVDGPNRNEQQNRVDGINRNEQQSRVDGANRNEQQNRIAGSNRNEQQSRVEGPNRYEGTGRYENGNRAEGAGRSYPGGRNDMSGRGDNSGRNSNPGRGAGRNESAGRSESAMRTESGYHGESSGRDEAANRGEAAARPDGGMNGELSRQDADKRERSYRVQEAYDEGQYPKELDSGVEASGILEVMPDGYGFIRCENYLPGENDVYVAPSQIRRFGLKTGDILRGNKRVKTQQEKFSALLFIRSINGYSTEEASRRTAFEDMTPIFPNKRIKLETPGCTIAMRVMDLVSPVGKGQRGMIVSPPKAGKTTLLKEVARSILCTNPHMHMLILLIDERPEEVTDIKEAIEGDNVEVIYSTFDELPEHHKRVSEMVIERAKRLVEHKMDVVILLDSITRLTRAYNQVVPPSGRTLSGGLDPSALHMPKRFFGAARNMREGGSLTILATALVETGSKMDDVVYEEFKGTGNMEMVLDRRLSEKRIFPAIDIQKSGTRREDLLLTPEELEAINIMRKALNSMKADEAADRILDMFSRTRSNFEFVQLVKKNKFI